MGFVRGGLTNGDVIRLTASGLPGIPGLELTGVGTRECILTMSGDHTTVVGTAAPLDTVTPTGLVTTTAAGKITLPMGPTYVLCFFPGGASGISVFQWYDVTGVATAIGRIGGVYPMAYDQGNIAPYTVIAKVDASAAAVDVECRCTSKFNAGGYINASWTAASIRAYG